MRFVKGMTQNKRQLPAHPAGEQPPVAREVPPAAVTVDSWAGQIKVEWDPQAPLTPLGQASFFIEFLKVAGVFDALVADCPLHRTSPNAPSYRNVLGTIVLSVLAGHKRYAHVTTLRADGVLPELLGIGRILSEDAVRRALAAIDEAAGVAWLQRHLDHCTEPLLGEGWILDAEQLRQRARSCVVKPPQPHWFFSSSKAFSQSAAIAIELAETEDRLIERCDERCVLIDLAAVAERVRHAHQTTLRIASTHAMADWVARALAGIAQFRGALAKAAEQLTPLQRWYRILSHALRHFLRSRVLQPPAPWCPGTSAIASS